MTTAILAIHCMVCVGIVITVLLQKGKGGDIGAVFGGSSQTVFGSGGAGNFLTKLTGGLAAAFFVTSMYLAYNSTRRLTSSIFTGAPAPISAPAKAPLPAPPVNKPSGSQK